MTNLQKPNEQIFFFSGKNFQTAKRLISDLNFCEYEVSDCNESEQNWFGLFLSETDAFWTVQMNNAGKYFLCVDDVKICTIDTDDSKKIDAFRLWVLGTDARSSVLFTEFLKEQNELWKNYGYGKI